MKCLTKCDGIQWDSIIWLVDVVPLLTVSPCCCPCCYWSKWSRPTDTNCLNWLFGCFGLWTCLFEAAMLNSHYARHYQADENGVHELLEAKTICNMVNPWKSEIYVIHCHSTSKWTIMSRSKVPWWGFVVHPYQALSDAVRILINFVLCCSCHPCGPVQHYCLNIFWRLDTFCDRP